MPPSMLNIEGTVTGTRHLGAITIGELRNAVRKNEEKTGGTANRLAKPASSSLIKLIGQSE